MAHPSPQNPGLLNWVLLIFLGFVWGAAFMSVRVALDGFGPWTVAAGRTLLGAIVLCAIGALMGQGLSRIPSAKAWGFCAVLGVGAIALPFSLLSLGQQYVPSAFAGVAMGAVPLMILPLVAIFSPEEGIGPRRIAGMCIGFVGLVILIGPGALDSTGDANEAFGRFACLGAAACYAVGSVITRRAPKMPPIAFAGATLAVAAATTVPVALVLEGIPQDWPALPLSGLIYAALLPTALAAVIRVRIITTAGSLFMSLVSYIVPVCSVILGVTLLGEELPSQLYLALAIILGGIGLSQSRALVKMFR
ncbi:MAG: DMT family transporter [Paracoccaceae bacterium]